MSLSEGYGVLVGTIDDYFRDPPDDFGNHYHGIFMVDTPAGLYRCAVNVDTPSEDSRVEYKVLEIDPTALASILQLPAGYHNLQSNSTSGALDYSRSSYLLPRIQEPIRKRLLFFFMGNLVMTFERNMLTNGANWIESTGDNALDEIESLADMNDVSKVLVFGEPFDTNLGMHNIHQNQGDPIGSQWENENAAWQDGAVIFVSTSGKVKIFINKFSTQSYVTDTGGHPL